MWANKWTRPRCTDRYNRSVAIAFLWPTEWAMLHYLAVRKTVVSVHRLVHLKITLKSLTWPTDRCSPRRIAFNTLLNAKAWVGTLTICLHSIKSSLPFLYPYVTHVINYPRPSPAFPYCKLWKAGRGLGTRLVLGLCRFFSDVILMEVPDRNWTLLILVVCFSRTTASKVL